MMQMKTWDSYWRVALAAGLLGALIAGCASLAMKNQYVSTAVIQVKGPAGSGAELRKLVTDMEIAVMSQDAMMGLIQSPQLNLYRTERRTVPMEDVAYEMRRKHARVEVLSGSNVQAVPLRVAFEYEDPAKARAVVAKLVYAFQTEALRNSVQGYVLEVLDNPMTPETPVFPARGNIATAGALAGIVLGVLTLLIWRRTRKVAA